MAPPRDFDPGADDLIADFGSATVARGTRYANLDRVRDVVWSDDGLELRGLCWGSEYQPYSVAVGFRRSGDRLRLDWAECSCPVGAYCKHAVALLMTASPNHSSAPHPDRWRTVFTKMLDELAPPVDGSGAPIGLQFSLAAPTRYRRGAAVTLRPVTLGKRGTWVRKGLTWQRLSYGTSPGEFDRRQYEALRALLADTQRSAVMPMGEAMMTSQLPPVFWSRLDEARDAGVTVVADGASGLHSVDFVKHARLRLDFVADGGGGATMSAVLVVDGEPRAPGAVGLIGSPAPHGMFEVADGVLRLGPFDPPPGRAALDVFARRELVHIPADTMAEFSLDILPRLSDVAAVEVAEGLFDPPTIVGPTPVLTVTFVADGVRAYWSTRYRVNDQNHDFPPDTPAGHVTYRDTAAETVAWQGIVPALRVVAAASGTWRQQALRHLQKAITTGPDGAAYDEMMAIGQTHGSLDAAAVASPGTLRAGVGLAPAEAAVLIGELLPRLDCRADFIVELDQSAPVFRPTESVPRLEFGSADGEPVRTDWFDLTVALNVEGQQLPIAAVIAELSMGATHMLLPSGVYFRLDTPEILRLRELIDEARALGEIVGESVNAGSRNVTLWEELLALGVVDAQLASWREAVGKLAAVRPPHPVEMPRGLHATLRDYQRDGLNWLAFLWDNELGGILADDMGLGKTVQTLALIARVAESGHRRFLVVAPTSVVTNWVAECHRFAPGLTAVGITGTEGRTGAPLAERVAAADIVVTSYALLRIDFEAYSGIDWAGVVFDEAQFLKNHTSKTHQCARRLDVRFKLAITGTPMENNLMELWALLSITAPGLFPAPKQFAEYFRRPIESGSDPSRLAVLRRRIKPMMLRRTKVQVAGELPPKQEQVLTLDLGPKHRKIYDTHLARERQKILGLLGAWDKNQFQIFRSLTLLRQLSLHAGLVDDTKLDVGAAKIEFLVEQLPILTAEGHSALVFSQFTGFLGILRRHLDAVGVSHGYLDGTSSSRQRDDAIQRFRTGASQVFLISLKAGGFGLNLTEADYCFICDPWWNPAAEAQAVDRTHRIGQTRPVTVYRLVSEGTIEEKVVELQARKRELFTAVVDDGDVFGSAITESDVRELLGG